MKRVPFMVADSSYIVRRGLVNTIEEVGNTSVVKEIDEASRIVKAVVELNPDYLIFNPNILPTGAVSLPCLFGQGCTTRFVALSEDINGFGFTGQTCETILMHEDKSSIVHKIKALVGIRFKELEVEPPIGELTPKEQIIVRDVALGLSNKEIADKNFISTHTVITHRKNISRKLGVKSASGLTVYAILNKLIDLEDVS